jgi:hypothetical protein
METTREPARDAARAGQGTIWVCLLLAVTGSLFRRIGPSLGDRPPSLEVFFVVRRELATGP